METVTIPRHEYEELRQQNADLQQRVEYLMAQMRLAKHKRFGSSSEKTNVGQLSLFDEAEASSNTETPEPEITEVKSHYRKKVSNSTERLQEDLPVEIIEYTIPESERICEECGDTLQVIGTNVRERLKLIPAKAVIVREIQYVYGCRHCEKEGCTVQIEKAPLPPALIKGSIATAESVAQIITQKFVMGVPLYRQEQEWNRFGIPLSRQTMSNWLIKCCEDYLIPVYDNLKKQLVQHQVLHADETTLQVLQGPDGKKKSYMWLYRTSGDAKSPIVLYDYKSGRAAEHPREFLKEFHGYLHSDGYSGYHRLPENITVVGCWAHARRKFDEALKGMPEKARTGSLAAIGKQYCDRLFRLEQGFTELSAEERYLARQEQSRPIIDEFFKWLYSLNTSSKSLFGTAAKYVLSQREYLLNYLLDGRLEISNNRAERSIKPFVIGRKNFLFANTPRGARASAVMYSLVETAKENGIHPYEYLVWVLKNAPELDLPVHPERANRLMPQLFSKPV